MEHIILIAIGLFLWWYSCAFLYNFFNELEDKCVNSHWRKPYKFLFWTLSLEFLNKRGEEQSWKNKWAQDKNGKLIPYTKKWYHLKPKPYKEKFPFSSGALVFLTDGEHTFQWFKNRSIEAGISIPFMVPGIVWLLGVLSFSFVKEQWLTWLDRVGGRH